VRKSQWFAGVGMSMVMAACGDDDGGDDDATPSSAAATCTKGCSRASAARCPSQPTNCQQRCEAQITSTPAGCIAYVNAYADCLNTAVFSCDSAGLAEARSCSAQLASWQACAGGGVSVPDASTPDGSGPSPIADSSVAQDSALPEAAVSDAAVPDAGSTPDAGIAQCAPLPGDGTCETCIKSACCPEVLDCDAECVALSDCGLACPSNDDGSCAANCDLLHPNGVDTLSELLSCANASCTVACTNAPVTSNSPRATQLR
jgi:hypothetical protein